MTQGTRRWDPWQELQQVQRELNRLFSDRRTPPRWEQAEFPPVNVWYNPENVLLTAEVPGVDPDELDVTVTADTVTLRGRRPQPEPREGENWYRRERPVGTFARTVQFPCEVSSRKAEATCARGVLTLRLPRPEEQKPKKVAVKAG